MSAFKGLNLFGSGPHRVAEGPRGQLVTVDFFGGGSGGGSTAQGATDWKVEVRGRLVAASESALRTLRAAIVAQADPSGAVSPGTLVNNHGASFANMTFVEYREEGPVDAGRAWSVGYVAVFQRL